MGEARQGGAVGAQQEGRLDQVALRLLDRQRGKLAVIERALRHHPVDRPAKLAGDLLGGDIPAPRDRRGASSASQAWALSMARSPPFTATYGMPQPSTCTLRGSAASRWCRWTQQKIDTTREQRVVGGPDARKILGQPVHRERRGGAQAGTGQAEAGARARAPATWRMTVAEASGGSSLPASSAAKSGSPPARTKAAASALATGAVPQWKLTQSRAGANAGPIHSRSRRRPGVSSTAAAAGASGGRRHQARARLVQAARPRHGFEHGTEAGLRTPARVGEAGLSMLMPRPHAAMVKKSTRVAAARRAMPSRRGPLARGERGDHGGLQAPRGGPGPATRRPAARPAQPAAASRPAT